MEKVVESWLIENSTWFEAFALKTLKLNTIEKWLQMNDKTICKCNNKKSEITNCINKTTNIINNHKPITEIINHENELQNKLQSSHSYTCVIHNKRISYNPRNYHRNDAFKMLSSTEELSSEDESKENAQQPKINSNSNGGTNFLHSLNQYPPLFNPSNHGSVSKRSNFFSMRKHHSLSSSSNSISNLNLLKYLIETKIKLPLHLNQHLYTDKLKLTSEKLNDTDFLLQLIKDISYELDLNTLSEKILGNIEFLLNADKASLFFVCHSRKCLASFKYDSHAGLNEHFKSKLNEDFSTQFFEMEVPFGQTILGHVAQTGNTINIKNIKQVV